MSFFCFRYSHWPLTWMMNQLSTLNRLVQYYWRLNSLSPKPGLKSHASTCQESQVIDLSIKAVVVYTALERSGPWVYEHFLINPACRMKMMRRTIVYSNWYLGFKLGKRWWNKTKPWFRTEVVLTIQIWLLRCASVFEQHVLDWWTSYSILASPAVTWRLLQSQRGLLNLVTVNLKFVPQITQVMYTCLNSLSPSRATPMPPVGSTSINGAKDSDPAVAGQAQEHESMHGWWYV